MLPQIVDRYTHPAQFQPLLPGERKLSPLIERAHGVVDAARSLQVGEGLRAQLADLLRVMNSFYSNKIEGEHTRPADLKRALERQFDDQPDIARKQRLAVAHMQAEAALERRLGNDQGQNLDWLYSKRALSEIHDALFRHAAPENIRLHDGSSLVPGAFRDRDVMVGRHHAPAHEHLDAFISAWCIAYGHAKDTGPALVSALASHHRLAWIHPWPDGTGRTCRLHTLLTLHALRLTRGLWSPLRGFARTEQEYRERLAAADEPRRNDLDGRGALTESGLVSWIEYSLSVCEDQIAFMRDRIDGRQIEQGLQLALQYEAQQKSGIRQEALRGLHYLYLRGGELARGEFKQMLPGSDRSKTSLLAALLQQGYLQTSSERGPVSFSLPFHALRFVLPRLWPEAEAG
ncbi:Fic family protein [Piscinibacterium candidicorallinum]|uniref:Fic family protein n=1 Tax=Piscinibacterium candidicorallinum TaxID=1793872 RepID=A0ABV7H6U3_9BURK